MSVSLEQVAGYLTPALGAQKANALLAEAAEALALVGTEMDQEQSLKLLEHIANNYTGLVGITARFAKSRLHLALVSDVATRR